MVVFSKTRPKAVQVPSIYLWAAGQKARANGCHDDFKKVSLLFSKSYRSPKNADKKMAHGALKLRLAIEETLNQGVIPFVRDELDLHLAAAIYNLTSNFKIRSEKSLVDSGFLRVRKIDIEYVDFSKKIIREDAIFPELLDPSSKKGVLNFLDDYSNQSFFYKTASKGKELLNVFGDFESFGEISKSLDCQISLWSKSESANSTDRFTFSVRKLGQANVKFLNKQQLVLTGLSAQIKLELTAASMLGHSLLIESEDLKIFGELPDLTTDDDSRIVAVDPVPLLKKFIFDQIPTTLIDQDAASYFSKKHSWFVPNDSKIWLEAITQ